MARIGAAMSVSGDMPDFAASADNFPFVSWRLLANLGMQAARTLYSGHLEGLLHPRSFSLSGAPLSKRGRRMVSFSIDRKKNAVIVRSFPMNVYRAGPGPADAKRTIGKRIFRSFRSSFNANAAASDILNHILNGQDGIFSKSDEWKTGLKRTRTNKIMSI